MVDADESEVNARRSRDECEGGRGHWIFDSVQNVPWLEASPTFLTIRRFYRKNDTVNEHCSRVLMEEKDEVDS